MREIRFAWICRNIHFNEIERVELTDTMLLDDSRPSWITSNNCEIIAKILPTSLKDKQDQEIWEGDLVVGKGSWGAVSRAEVFFNYNGAYVEVGDFRILLSEFREIEVIGNIWEHPELPKDS